MKPITAAQIRESLTNAGPDIAEQMTMPGLHEIIWEARDFLGWHDTRSPQRAYISYWREYGLNRAEPSVTVDDVSPASPVLTTIMLRVPNGSPRNDILSICAFCGTQQPARMVRLFTAPKAADDGSSVGTYLCDDFSCSLTIRNARPHDLQADFSAHIHHRIERLQHRLDGFVGHVIATT